MAETLLHIANGDSCATARPVKIAAGSLYAAHHRRDGHSAGQGKTVPTHHTTERRNRHRAGQHDSICPLQNSRIARQAFAAPQPNEPSRQALSAGKLNEVTNAASGKATASRRADGTKAGVLMPKRYLTRPKHVRCADWYDGPDAESYLSRQVYETGPTPYQTGILDQYGEPLYAAYELDPVGFVRFDTDA